MTRKISPSAEISDYFDLTLKIHGENGPEYTVELSGPDGATKKSPIQSPFADPALENLLEEFELNLLYHRGSRSPLTPSNEKIAQKLGAHLFSVLFKEQINGHYIAYRKDIKKLRKPLRIRLSIDSPKLATLPWELLYDVESREFVCLSGDTSIIRYPELPTPMRPISVKMPLRILVVIANPSSLQFGRLNVEREEWLIQSALKNLEESGIVEIVWLKNPDWTKMERTLESDTWHAIHWIGHGFFDDETEEGQIVFVDKDGFDQLVSATDFASLLTKHHLNMVFLNTCEGARGSATDLYSSTAMSLAQKGIPAVVAMQYEISDESAIAFAETFYTAVAHGNALDEATAKARRALKRLDRRSLEWGTPVLYTREINGKLFDIDVAYVRQLELDAKFRREEKKKRLQAAESEQKERQRQEVDAKVAEAVENAKRQLEDEFDALKAQQEKSWQSQLSADVSDAYRNGYRTAENEALKREDNTEYRHQEQLQDLRQRHKVEVQRTTKQTEDDAFNKGYGQGVEEAESKAHEQIEALKVRHRTQTDTLQAKHQRDLQQTVEQIREEAFADGHKEAELKLGVQARQEIETLQTKQQAQLDKVKAQHQQELELAVKNTEASIWQQAQQRSEHTEVQLTAGFESRLQAQDEEHQKELATVRKRALMDAFDEIGFPWITVNIEEATIA